MSCGSLIFCRRCGSRSLPLLIGHFLKQLNTSLGKHVTSVAPEAMRLLESYSWPGNVRELQSAIKYAYVQSVGEVITSGVCRPNYDSERLSPDCPLSEAESAGLNIAEFVSKLLQADESGICGEK